MAGDWNSAAHPRAPKGPGGGEFAGKSGSSTRNTSIRKSSSTRAVPKGSLGFNGKTGTGYGKKGGDARVRKLQQALNKLGIKDANGKPLVVDGDLGPKTTAAIRAWQRKNGQKATGFVDAATLRKLGRGSSTHHARARAASRAKKATSASSGRAPR